MKRGMLLGKFMPLHKGHVYLIEFAMNYVDELTVVVGTLASEPIAGEVRYHWVKEMFPSVNVVHLQDENPQHPHEHPNFWQIWQKSLQEVLPWQPDLVFASEDYGFKLAEVLDAEFMSCDEARSIVPVCGTEIRKNPWDNWEFLPRIVRPYYCRKICIFGPESTGKSTLTKNLATHFKSIAVPEYARTYLECHGTDLKFDDIEKIARGQLASEKALIANAEKLIFCDTDVLSSRVWSEFMFNKCSDWLLQKSLQTEFDLYLLLDVDVPWVNEAVRYLPNERRTFFNACKETLDKHNKNYCIISGTDWQDRFELALREVNKIGDLK